MCCGHPWERAQKVLDRGAKRRVRPGPVFRSAFILLRIGEPLYGFATLAEDFRVIPLYHRFLSLFQLFKHAHNEVPNGMLGCGYFHQGDLPIAQTREHFYPVRLRDCDRHRDIPAFKSLYGRTQFCTRTLRVPGIVDVAIEAQGYIPDALCFDQLQALKIQWNGQGDLHLGAGPAEMANGRGLKLGTLPRTDTADRTNSMKTATLHQILRRLQYPPPAYSG